MPSFLPLLDWFGTFYPATLNLLRGDSLNHLGFFNPTYALAPLIPFALLGNDSIYVLFSILAFGLIALRLNFKWWSILSIVLSPFILASVKYGNIEWLVLLGLIMPKPIGMIFLLIKPQMTFILVLYWIYRAYGQRQVVKLIAPSIIAFGISFLLEPSYITRMLMYANDHNAIANFSLFPYGILVSFVLLVLVWKQRKDTFALSASAFLSPYITLTAWSVTSFQFVKHKYLALISLGLQWFVIMRIV